VIALKHAAFFIFIAAAVFMCCCDAPRSEALQTRGNAIIRNGATKRFKHEAPYASTDDAATDDTDADNALAEKRAQLIAERVTSVEGVDRASVVINNNTAIIGIEVRDEMDDADVAQVKEKAEQAARAYDKNIERVVVTASDELVERLLKRADCVSGSPIDPESEGGKLIEQFTPIL
jgi:YhcN/YlaJ family sporulation lipoprotein